MLLLKNIAHKKIGLLDGTSSASLNTFLSENKRKQILRISDPTVQRGTAIPSAVREEEVLERAIRSCRQLLVSGAEVLIFGCFSLYRLLPKFPSELRRKIISLPELGLELVKRKSVKSLLLSTHELLETQIFEGSPSWNFIDDLIVKPNAEDQAMIEKVVADLRWGGCPHEAWSKLFPLKSKYGVDRLLGGAMEFFLVAKEYPRAILDPLEHLTGQLNESGASARSPRPRFDSMKIEDYGNFEKASRAH